MTHSDCPGWDHHQSQRRLQRVNRGSKYFDRDGGSKHDVKTIFILKRIKDALKSQSLPLFSLCTELFWFIWHLSNINYFISFEGGRIQAALVESRLLSTSKYRPVMSRLLRLASYLFNFFHRPSLFHSTELCRIRCFSTVWGKAVGVGCKWTAYSVRFLWAFFLCLLSPFFPYGGWYGIIIKRDATIQSEKSTIRKQ